MMRIKPNREHAARRLAVLALTYLVEGTALHAVTRPVFILWRMASKVGCSCTVVVFLER
jgi:hypothetical protein